MKLSRLFKGDTILWVVFFLLSIISLVAVYSSIGLYAYSLSQARPTGLFLKHTLIVLATYAAIVLISRVDYRYFSRFAMLGYWASLLLLAVMMALHSRWFRLPVIGQFQPSEIAKVVLIVFVARLITKSKDKLDDLGTFFLLLISIAAVVIFILPENFSTAALIFIACYLMMYFGGVNKRYWWRGFAVGVVAVAIGLLLSYNQYEKKLIAAQQTHTEQVLERSTTWGHRLYSWVNPNPDELTQENRARMAVARGGVVGTGIGNTVHARLMTQAHNDFIYAIIIEETGLIGGALVFLLYAIFYFRCIQIARRCRGTFGSLTVAGMGTVIYIQALVNMCVAVGVLPVTGQTLPFISYGGTAYLFLGCGFGVIQAVAADNAKERTTPLPEGDDDTTTPDTPAPPENSNQQI